MTRYTQQEIDWVEYEHFRSFGWDEQKVADRRSFALALLAAASWAEGQDVLAQRRARKAAEEAS